MTELGMGADLLRLVGRVFWVVVLGALLAALLVPKSRKGKIIAVCVVAGAFAAFPGRWAWNDYQVQRAYQARLSEATARFNERCKTAGERIYKTVEGVEGVMLLKLRPTEHSGSNQNAVDPYGHESWGEGYIISFLMGRDGKGSWTEKGTPEKPGYLYVEAIDPKDGKRYRYTGRIDQPWLRDKNYGEWVRRFVFDKIPAAGPAPRYGVTYDDISTPEERALWIAGSSLRVIDTETKEVIAERIGYMIDRGLGSTAGHRVPWDQARRWACPAFTTEPGNPIPSSDYQTRLFVEKVLKIRENSNERN